MFLMVFFLVCVSLVPSFLNCFALEDCPNLAALPMRQTESNELSSMTLDVGGIEQ